MAQVMFKKGLLSALPSSYTAGTFYVTTDEPGLYLDISDSARVRFGDFQEFATLTALQAHTNPSTTVLYYVKDINCLAKWDGTQYVQINRDTGVTSVSVVGSGNVITDASYDASTRVLTLTKGITAATPADIVNAVGDLTYNEVTYDTVKDYVDAKTSGIATDAALSDLQKSVDALEELVGESPVDDQIDAKIEALNLAETYEPIGAQAAAEKTAADALAAYAEVNDAAVEAAATAAAGAKSAADAAQGEVDALELVVDGKADKATTLAGYGITDGMTAEEIAAAISAAAYNDTEVKADIAENAQAIADEVSRAKAAEEALDLRLDTIEVFFESADNSTEVVDTLKEIQEYIASDESGAAAMAGSIKANEEAIDAIEADYLKAADKTELQNNIDALGAFVGDLPEGATAETVVGYVDEKVAALKIGDYAKAADLNDLAGRVGTAEGEIDALQAAVATKAESADLVSAVERIVELEKVDHEHSNKSVLDGITAELIADWNDAVSKEHEHSNKSVLDGITGEKVAAWDAAEQNAKDYADGLASNYDAAGAAATAETNAKNYVNGLLTWGEF